jgi:16S rRNA pseudouridine516 synthase
MRLVRRLANLGYGSRKQVAELLRCGRVTDAVGKALSPADDLEHAQIRVDGQPLDPPRLLVMLHKPLGYTCSLRDAGPLVHDLFPPRYRLRAPTFAMVGRLDRDTSGLLLLTDDGALLHRITAPRSHLRKVYVATLAHELRGDEARLFASGTLTLEGETKPLAPASLEVLMPQQVRLTLTEGRYHQVRRMFAAVGNHVESLHRSQIGGLGLDDLPLGCWRALTESDRHALFGGPPNARDSPLSGSIQNCATAVATGAGS